MDTTTCAQHLADPLGTVGMSFYFSPQAVERGQGIELDVVTFYAAGRGGVLGDLDAVEVDRIFYFFREGLVATMVEKARAGAPREQAVAEHLGAANDFAEATFGGIDPAVLDAFSAAAAALAGSLERGRWPLVDGYLDQPVPTDPVHAAYYWAIVLRELRGGVHTDAVLAEGITAAASCQLDRGGAYFGLHGYQDADRVEETPELIARREAVEVDTTVRMATLLEALTDAQRQALVDGAAAMHGALAAPVPVA